MTYLLSFMFLSWIKFRNFDLISDPESFYVCYVTIRVDHIHIFSKCCLTMKMETDKCLPEF